MEQKQITQITQFVTDWQQPIEKPKTYTVNGNVDFNPDDYIDCKITAMSDSYKSYHYSNQ